VVLVSEKQQERLRVRKVLEDAMRHPVIEADLITAKQALAIVIASLIMDDEEEQDEQTSAATN
jgi:hypothetical protein